MSNNANKRKSNGVSVGNGDNSTKKNSKIAEASQVEKNQVPLKKQKIENVTQKKTNQDVKMVESSDSSDSSSESDSEVKKTPITSKATQKADIKTQPSKNNSTASVKKTATAESSDSDSSSSSESEEEVKKPVLTKKPSTPAPSKIPAQKNTSTPAKKVESDSDSSDSSSSEDESPAPKTVEKKIVVEKKSVVEKNSNSAKNAVDAKKTVPEKKAVVEKKTITTMTSDGAVKFRSENNVTFEDAYRGEEFAPILDFEDAASIFPANVMAATKKFKKPTPIQSQSWPVVRSGRDLVAIAETGSGKTLAFTLPVLAKIVSEAADKPASKALRTPLVLVLSPTRELAMQTAEVCEVAGASCGLRSLCVYGGTPKEGNVREIKKGIDILIATPGRLMDLMDNDKVLKLDKVAHLVLDEADRMLDMGFEPAIRRIVADVPKERQTLMFSATWPQSIQALANEFLIEPAKVVIGSQDLTANHKVTQIVEVMEGYQKDQRLQDLLNKYHKSRKNRILIFALYKKEAERIENTLRRKGWNVQGIHGDKSQIVRSKAIESFRDGTIPLLVATDVAARGLDIPDVEYVINVTFPLTIEDYVHRIGRTGRAGKTGTSHTFFTVDDKAHAGELQQVLREANQDVPEDLSKFGSHVKKKEHALYGSHFKKVDTAQKATRITFD